MRAIFKLNILYNESLIRLRRRIWNSWNLLKNGTVVRLAGIKAWLLIMKKPGTSYRP